MRTVASVGASGCDGCKAIHYFLTDPDSEPTQNCQPKSARYVRSMSAIGFSPGAPNELDQLREAYRSLNDITRNLVNAQKCLQQEDLRMAEHHLRAAEWHLGQAKQRIASVGQLNAGE